MLAKLHDLTLEALHTGAQADDSDRASSEPAADFSDAATMSTRSDGQLFYQILMGGGERCAMPAFGPESAHAWSEDKSWRMVAFARLFARAEAK